MNIETLEKAKELQEEIEILEESVDFFDYDKHSFISRTDREKANETRKNLKFPFILEGIFKNSKNNARLNVKGFFGGKTIECDEEFVKMCHQYFKGRLQEKNEEFKNLE